MNKSLRDQLVEKGLAVPRKQTGSKSAAKRAEQFSERDLMELMGTNRPTYGRKKGGAYRQR